MRIQQLHYIVKIVETGSMNEAAKQLFITQPSLSNAVRDLEREMGIKIFIRNPKGITLISFLCAPNFGADCSFRRTL